MNRYWYRIKNHFGTGISKVYASGQVHADTMDKAHEQAMLLNDVILHTDYHDEGSIMAGCVWRQFYKMNGKKVEIAIFKTI